MATPVRPVLAIVLVAVLALAGCTAQRSGGCEATATSPGATGVCIVSEDDWVLQGVEWNAGTNASTVLLVHGLREQHRPYDALALDLADAGYHVLAFDARGHGKSTQRLDGRTHEVSNFTRAELFSMLGDLEAAASYLGDQPDAIVGASIGANQALVHASEQPRVRAVVLLSPDPGAGPLLAAPANEAYDGAIHFMASQEDTRASQAARSLHANHTGPKDLTIWDGKGHGTNMLDAETRAILVGWLRGHVRASG